MCYLIYTISYAFFIYVFEIKPSQNILTYLFLLNCYVSFFIIIRVTLAILTNKFQNMSMA